LANPDAILAAEGIVKTFPGVRALKGVSLAFAPGTIHAVVGENGAGKSTLMRILAGVHRADEGQILLDGSPLVFASAAEAFARGIAMVYQDTRLVATLDIAWNIALGHEAGGGVFVDRGAMIAQAQAILARLGVELDPTLPVSALSRAQQQLVEIARALARRARVLILDEPTSALTSAETDALFVLLRALRDEGTAVVFISHRMPEVMAISDVISVLKDGELVGTLCRAEATTERVVTMMVGREMRLIYPRATRPIGDPVLAVDGLVADGLAQPISFGLRSGEILGFGGIQGSGQQEAARALFGLGLRGGAMTLLGRRYDPAGPADAIAADLIYMPADRREEGLLPAHSIRANIALPHLRQWSAFGLVDRAREDTEVRREVKALSIRTPTIEQPVALLSGGNQQKVVFARWWLKRPRVYVFDEPTQGVDVATKLELYRLIRSLADDGAAVIVISSDVLELIGMTDRILVFSAGAITDEVPSDQATEERIVGSAVRHSGARASSSAGAKSGRRSRNRPVLNRYLPTFLLLAVALVIVAVTTWSTPYFFTARNLFAVSGQSTSLAVAALGQTAVILLGGIDLSVGPLISLMTTVASWLVVADGPVPIWVGIAACLAIGAVVGLANAALIEWLRIPDLVATLATYSMVLGVALIIRPSPGGEVDRHFADLVTWKVGLLPVNFLIVLALYAGAELLLLRGHLGGRMYALGASREAAIVLGLPIRAIRSGSYVFCSICASLAGLVVASRIGSGDPQAGATFTLATVTSVVVGGTSIFGGSGAAIGTLVGVLLIVLMQNALNQLQVTAYWQYIWTGALTLIAVTVYAVRSDQSGWFRALRFGLPRRWLGIRS
jgi:ribose transport system ATP-binding protein